MAADPDGTPTATEVRGDPLRGHRVALTPGREMRPRPASSAPDAAEPSGCAFCPGHESETPPGIAAWNLAGAEVEPDRPDWQVRVVPNLYPAFPAHEVVIETPHHDRDWDRFPPEEVARVLEAWRSRLAFHLDAWPGAHVQLFRNQGAGAGATRTHPHSQLVVIPETPPALARERAVFAAAGAGACPVCGELREARRGRLLDEEGDYVALAPWAPRVPFELWVVPGPHRGSFVEEGPGDLHRLAALLVRVRRRLRTGSGILPWNVGLVSLDGSDAPGHWRLELLPRKTPLAGFETVTGMYLNEVPPEESIRRLLAADPEE